MGFLNIPKRKGWAMRRNLVGVFVGCAVLAVLGIFFYGVGFVTGVDRGWTSLPPLEGIILKNLEGIILKTIFGFVATCISIVVFFLVKEVGYVTLRFRSEEHTSELH